MNDHDKPGDQGRDDERKDEPSAAIAPAFVGDHGDHSGAEKID